MKTIITFAFSIALVMVAGAVQEYYVDAESGSDSAAGTKTAPFKTIQKATTTGRYLEADIVVHIAPGVYEPASIRYRGTPTYAIALVGEGTDENPVVIDGGGTNSCVRLENSNRRASFSNIVFKNGRYEKGGGICCVRGWTTDNVSGVTNCVFVNCTATNGQGGAVFSSHLSSAFQSCVFSNCTSTGGGGAVALAEAQDCSTFKDCLFLNNTSGTQGGAVYFDTPTNNGMETNTLGLVLGDCSFTNNSAIYGGAVCGSVSRATNCLFVANNASSIGGVWFYDGYKGTQYSGRHMLTNTFEDCEFKSNSAELHGGVIGFKWAKRFLFDGCEFVDNSAQGNGSVLCGYKDTSSASAVSALFVNDCTFERNIGTNAIYIGVAWGVENGSYNFGESARVQFHNSRFSNNDSQESALIFNSARMLVNGCKFSANVGGPVVHCFFNDQVNITNTFYNCLFHHNTNRVNDGIVKLFWAQARAAEIENCTFVDNVAAMSPYAVASDSWDSTSVGCVFANILVCGNVSTNGTTGTQISNMVKTHCVNSWLETGAADISDGVRNNIIGDDPRFSNRAAGDYSLKASSPCRDAGRAFAWMETALDIRNDPLYPRIVNGTPDIGCYEYISDYSGFKIFLK